jgi:hypothetical protein
MRKVAELVQQLHRIRLPILMISLIIIPLLLLYKFNHQVVLKYVNRIEEGHQALMRQIFQNAEENAHQSELPPVNYAVFCTATPNGESYRSYDYAYNLPLTALAWERIGFKSIALIIGSRCEWENDPALRLILSRLEERRGTAIFIDSPLEYRTTLSQTARIFVANMPQFPGKDGDYLITSDADLWPLRKEHFIPRPNMNIVLLHGECCGEFKMNNKSYRMYPMSNIGANVSTWREIMNDHHSVAYDSTTILDYFAQVFGELAKSPVVVGGDTWYMDQKLVSIRLAEWMDLNGQSNVYRVSDSGFSRVDRASWTQVEKLDSETFKTKYDSHLLGKGYLPVQQAKLKPLIHLMYGNKSWESKWIDEYNQEFLKKVRNWAGFHELG